MQNVERNPLRSNYVERAEVWHGSPAYVPRSASADGDWLATPSDPPLPRTWQAWGNSAQSEPEVDALRHSLHRGLPFNNSNWVKSIAARLILESNMRPRGRPRKET